MSKYTKCSSCGKEILFVPMLDSGKMMPIDAESIQKYIVLNGSHTKGAIRDCGIPHWKTCPNSNRHRKNNKGEKK